MDGILIPEGCYWQDGTWHEPPGLSLTDEERQCIQKEAARRKFAHGCANLISAHARLMAAMDHWRDTKKSFAATLTAMHIAFDEEASLPVVHGDWLIDHDISPREYIVKPVRRT